MLIYQYNACSYNTPTFSGNMSRLTKNKLKKLVAQGLNDQQIGEMYNVSKSTIGRKRRKHDIEPFTKNDIIEYDKYDFYYLRTLIDEGNSLSQIAEFYKRSVSHMRQVLKHFNLKTQEAILAASVKKEELGKLISAGKTQQEIAQELFLENYNTVTHLIKKFGLETPISKLDKILPIGKIADLIFRGMKPNEIAQKYKIDESGIRNKMKSTGFDDVYKELYQPHDIPKEEILSLIRSDYTTGEIAEMYHCSIAQMVKYMVKNKILKTEIPLKELIKSVENGMTIKDIAISHDTFKNRVPKLLTENNLKTRGQVLQTPLPMEVIQEKIQGCKTYTELAKRLGISPGTAKRQALNYGLDIEREILVLPEVSDINRIMEINPKISVDELAGKLNVETRALERVLNKNKIKIYKAYRVYSYYSWDFVKWVSWHMKHGDSPVQLGELFGLSSSKARKIVENLSEEYKDGSYIDFPKIPKDKLSPTSESIIRSIIKASKEYLYPKKNPYNYSQIYLAKDFIKVQICKKYKISDSTFEYLLNKYDLSDIYETYAKKMADRI